MKMICKVIECNKKAYTGQEGYCSKHYDDLERMREKNKKAEEEAEENEEEN